MTEQEKEHRLFAYLARFGQHPETQRRYGDAVRACQNIENLEQTVSEIAREYGVNPECLRNQLKRHFPDLLPLRNKIQEMMGCLRKGNRGLKSATVNKYAPAIELLSDPSLTVREVATRCNVPYQGLQAYLLCYHKDIAEKRMLYRTDAMLRQVSPADRAGSPSANGGLMSPRPETVAIMAPAVKMYRETDLPLCQIAARFGVSKNALFQYLNRWYPDYVRVRRESRQKELEAKRLKHAARPNRSGPVVARERYTPAIEMLRQGKTLSQAAKELGVDLCNLGAWLKKNHPEILQETHAGMMVLPDGKKTLRRSYDRFLPVMEYMTTHPSKSTQYLSRKFGIPVSSLTKYISKYFPEQWARHCRACARKPK